jgi:hypothetical protein
MIQEFKYCEVISQGIVKLLYYEIIRIIIKGELYTQTYLKTGK